MTCDVQISWDLFITTLTDDGMTICLDRCHICKRFRNRFIGVEGVRLFGGFSVTASVLRSLYTLVQKPMPNCFDPGDKQNVPAALRVLECLWTLPGQITASGKQLSAQLQSVADQLLCIGPFVRCLHQGWFDCEIDLLERLTILSTASHLLLAMYVHSTGFISNHLFLAI